MALECTNILAYMTKDICLMELTRELYGLRAGALG